MANLKTILTVAVAFVAAEQLFAQTEFSGTTMGPIAYRVLVCDDIENPGAIKSGIDNKLQQVNSLMSTYIADSDVSKINTSGANIWIEVDPLTLAVIQRAMAISEQTDGAFDITIGPAVRRWKFGPDADDVQYPSDDDVEEMLQYVGYKKVSIKPTPPSVKKSDARTQIDLSAIAKGFAVDHVVEYLKENSFENFMVEVGGEVYAAGKKPSGAWRIGIEKPKIGYQEISHAIDISDCAIATSGDYRTVAMFEGKKITHTIDPKTCRPVPNPPASCSVRAADCMTADALATAIMVLGAKKGMKLCDSTRCDAHIVIRTGDAQDGLTSYTTEDFPAFVDQQELRHSAKSEETSIWPAFIAALAIFSLAVLGMAVGAIFNQKPISGSCGGIATTTGEDGESSCTLCHKPVADCPEKQETT